MFKVFYTLKYSALLIFCLALANTAAAQSARLSNLQLRPRPIHVSCEHVLAKVAANDDAEDARAILNRFYEKGLAGSKFTATEVDSKIVSLLAQALGDGIERTASSYASSTMTAAVNHSQDGQITDRQRLQAAFAELSLAYWMDRTERDTYLDQVRSLLNP